MKLGGRSVSVPSDEALDTAEGLAKTYQNGELLQRIADIREATALWHQAKADSEGIVVAAKERLAAAERREAEIAALDAESTQRNSDALARIAEQQAEVDRDRRRVDEDRKDVTRIAADAQAGLDTIARFKSRMEGF